MALRKRYSRYRKTSRKRFSRRFRKRRTYCCSKPEGKTCHLKSVEQALSIAYGHANDDQLYNHQNIQGSMWAHIAEGTAYNERIGNTISAVGLRLRMLCVGCPSTDYQVTDFYMRLILWVGDNTANTTIDHFFAVTGQTNFHKPINRKNVHQVVYDRIMKVTSSWTTIYNATNDQEVTGPILCKNVYIPFKRRIVYNVAGGVKDDKNRLNVAILVATPYMTTATNTRQVGCITNYSTLYYTDA